MTTNQTIDGVLVSRELIERITNPFGDVHDKFNAVQELRALLDVPAPEPIPIGEGTGRLLTAYNAGEFSNEGGSETVESLSVEAYDAEQDQFDADSYMHGYCVAIYAQAQPLLLHLTKHHGEAEAEQPAPVAVVLPERRAPEHYQARMGKCAAAELLADEWNACLDELKRLNPSL